MTNGLTRSSSCSMEPLEKRQMLAVSPVFAGTKIKGINLSAGNISTNQTLITIPFTGDIVLVDQSKLRLFAYAINPLSANLGQVKKTINVVKAEVIAVDANNDGVDEHNYLQITTDRLMRKGGTIILNEGALQDTNGDTLAAQTLKTVKGQNRERFTLANRAFLPNTFHRFTNEIFAKSPTPADASGAIPDATVTANLQTFLNKKVTAGLITQAQADAAMTRYNSDAAKGTIPPANLRAALFSLTGTFAEGAIAAWLDGANVTGKPYTIITFQNPDDPTVPVAQTSARPSDGRLRTVFKPQFQGEPFQVLSGWVAHEALHQDNTFTLQEEQTAEAFGILAIAQQAQTDASFISAGTTLVNRENVFLLAMLNSGRTIFPYVGVLNAPMLGAANGVFPGQKAATDGGGVYTSFNDYVRRKYIERGSVDTTAPGNALLESYYTKVTNRAATPGMQFSNTIINDIDSFQAPLGTHGAILIAQALKLGLS